MLRPPKMFSCLVICFASVSVIPLQVEANKKGEPQMVWVNYAEGEVKFSPGHRGKPELGKDWIEANRGQVMEDGYTLATEKGRAEIEFEDGTVVYLAEHSALEFDWLWVTESGATETELSLLTGKATVAHESNQELKLDTPTMTLPFSKNESITVESALDGVVVEAVDGPQAIVGNRVPPLQRSALAITFAQGQAPIPLLGVEETAAEQEWDQWVVGQLATRRALVAEGMKESGLKEPIPGLAGMMENGKFFDCAPYGRCWKPIELNVQVVARNAQASPGGTGRGQGKTPGKRRKVVVNQTMLYRCPMEAWMDTYRDPRDPYEIAYATCFAGSWVGMNWVAGRRHHHHHPCHFVKEGHHRIGIIPRHPLDQKGQPPINAKSGVLVLAHGKNGLQAGVESAPSKGMHLVASVPRGMDRGLMASAPRLAQPVIEARFADAIVARGGPSTGRVEGQKPVTTMRFDYKTGNFVGRSGAGSGGSGHGVVVAHMGGGGRVGGGGVSGGGSHGSSGGGGSSSGGGGGHSGGGSSGGSASASSGASAGGGGGGGHH